MTIEQIYPAEAIRYRGAATRRFLAAIAVAAAAGLLVAHPSPARAGAAGRTVTIRSGTLTVVFAPRVYTALTRSTTTGGYQDTRSLSPTAPGTSRPGGAFAFPLTGGRLNVTALTGEVTSRGGIEFTNDDQNPTDGTTAQFTFASFAVTFASTPAGITATFSGASTYPGVAFATLGTAHVHRATHGRTVSLSGLSLKLTPAAARLFKDQASGSFAAGESVGSASLTATS